MRHAGQVLRDPAQRLPSHGLQLEVDGQPWNKQAPAPKLPADVVEHTAATYREALQRLTQ